MAPNPNVDDLERDIFGGSDSELSDEEEEVLPKQLVQDRRRRERSPAAAPGGGDYESSGGDSEDDYQDRRSAKPKKKKAGARKTADDDGEGGAGERRRTVTRKRKRKQQPVEIDLNDLPPEQASKIRLDQQIEAILKPKKGNRQKKRKNDEEVLDRFADEEVARLREAMTNAANEDAQANREKMPATAKLRLLPEVIEVLRKAALAQSIVDNNLLEGVRRWLEPLPDRSLPALNIQREFFPILKKMEFIDSAVLKESGLGRVVLFYTKCKRVTPDVGRIANDLVSTWSRPIIKRSASYRDRIVPTAIEGEGGESGVGRERLNAILARAKESEKNRVRKNAVMIPQRELGSYTVAPKMNAGIMKTNASVDVDIDRRKKNAERMRALTRKVNNKL